MCASTHALSFKRDGVDQLALRRFAPAVRGAGYVGDCGSQLTACSAKSVDCLANQMQALAYLGELHFEPSHCISGIAGDDLEADAVVGVIGALEPGVSRDSAGASDWANRCEFFDGVAVESTGAEQAVCERRGPDQEALVSAQITLEQVKGCPHFGCCQKRFATQPASDDDASPEPAATQSPAETKDVLLEDQEPGLPDA